MGLKDFIINLNKPEGISSHTAVQKVKTSLSLSKAGHAGTLDPSASGVLIVCCNRATGASRFLSDLDKEYLVTMRLGIRTDTMDREGKIIEERSFSYVTGAMVEDILPQFTGAIFQKPPMFSAIKQNGVPLYKYARKGITLERKERQVHIYRIDLIHFGAPFVTLRVCCSKGTYIRSLCSDMAEGLKTCSHIHSLQRTRTGKFLLNDSLNMEDLSVIHDFIRIGGSKSLIKESWMERKGVYSLDNALSHLCEIYLSSEETRRLLMGQQVKRNTLAAQGFLRIKDHESRLLGIGVSSSGQVKVSRFLVNSHKYLKQNANFSIQPTKK